MIRTSDTHPLRIAELRLGEKRGRIGITFAPGKWQPDAMTGAWKRALCADLDRIAEWNAATVVTLIDREEIDTLRIEGLGVGVRERNIEWHHWPIADYSVPDAGFEAMWPERSQRLRSQLECGLNVLIHCKGGLGRAGMIAARLLVEMGMSPQQAIERVRAARGDGAIETDDQEAWVWQACHLGRLG